MIIKTYDNKTTLDLNRIDPKQDYVLIVFEKNDLRILSREGNWFGQNAGILSSEQMKKFIKDNESLRIDYIYTSNSYTEYISELKKFISSLN